MIESQHYGGFLSPETQVNASSPRRRLSDQHTLPVLWTSRLRSRPQNGSANNRGREVFGIARKNETTNPPKVTRGVKVKPSDSVRVAVPSPPQKKTHTPTH